MNTSWPGPIAKLLDEERRAIKKNELWETYMNNGARFLNAFTSNDATCYFAYLPSNRIELFMDMESDRMASPVFREFWSERDVIMEERRLGENDPDEQLGESFYAVAFMASPYKWPVVGWMSDLQSIDRQASRTITACTTRRTTRGDPRRRRDARFGPETRREVLRADSRATEAAERARRANRSRRASGGSSLSTRNPKLMIGFHKPVYPDPDDAAISVLESILGKGRTSRLYKSVFEAQELTARAPGVYDGPGDPYDNLLVIEAAPRNPAHPRGGRESILGRSRELKTELVTDRELQRVKNQIDASNIRQLGSNIGIAFQVGFGQIFYGDYHAMFRRIERIKKVSPRTSGGLPTST